MAAAEEAAAEEAEEERVREFSRELGEFERTCRAWHQIAAPETDLLPLDPDRLEEYVPREFEDVEVDEDALWERWSAVTHNAWEPGE
jgi:hypothetical protein